MTENEKIVQFPSGDEPSVTATEKEVELTPKQKEKQEKQAKAYWNTMISRKEAYEMVQAGLQQTEQRLQLLLIQNRTLLEILQIKDIATEEEIKEHSKEVITSIFGPLEDSEAVESEE